MKLAKIIFWTAAIYGILALLPGFFAEAQLSPPLAHPEYYYGFFGLAVVFQLVFILIARDPLRYRPLIPIAILEKAAFFFPTLLLWSQGRIAAGTTLAGAIIDGMLMLLFIAAWFAMRGKEPERRLPE